MRLWYPIKLVELDNKRLLGCHNEILIIGKAIHAITHNIKYGFKRHPETLRWVGHTKALAQYHDAIAMEMLNRGFNHKSPWPQHLINLDDSQDFPNTTWEPLETMQLKLNEKQTPVQQSIELDSK